MDDDGIHDEVLALGVQAARVVANAITPLGAGIGHDASGSSVGSLTEAVMGVTAGLMAIAEAINDLADAVRGTE